jgi:hypothetical protein
MPWGLIALVAFWVVAIRLWIVDGPKVPLVFMAIWAAGYFGLPALGVQGYFVVAFQAVLAVILLIVERYKDTA